MCRSLHVDRERVDVVGGAVGEGIGTLVHRVVLGAWCGVMRRCAAHCTSNANALTSWSASGAFSRVSRKKRHSTLRATLLRYALDARMSVSGWKSISSARMAGSTFAS